MHIPGAVKSFQYLGAKFSYLPWLLRLLPECFHYIEVFGGSAVVLLNRKPSPIETYNDLNESVVNLFQVLRNKPEEFKRLIELTPHSFLEYKRALYNPEDSDLERARKFFIRTNQSFHAVGAQQDYGGWLAARNSSRRGMGETTNKWLSKFENLQPIIDRFKTVQIECRDFEFVIDKYDSANSLFYCDPPYVTTHRSKSRYEFDFKKPDFLRFREVISRVKGRIAISNYDTDFTRQLFKELKFHPGPHRRNNTSEKTIYEALWTNY